ncbi:helix-turn-helix transcriptional regulator [Schleiferilactobacillus shenzhenensis]|uniref:HTH cro/C1-type domain-containing protein n=1 Tax=Schleiferilactobacillus shenzhenensis LY-73 TaxID=1231336 RepID=U4TXV0_9LACO|nr:helix-turn-helix domain-containing protein [Schleiferilactobacillus shenzhenensis]ERL66638.1 hypothetical protein L248_0317 [Schleiferilactobacillus shenzhenensis LY-73]
MKRSAENNAEEAEYLKRALAEHTVPVDDLFADDLKDPEFRKGFTEEYNRLVSAAAVVEAREKAGLTQQELADRAEVPQSTIARIERGRNTSIDTLSKIAAALNLPLTVKFG